MSFDELHDPALVTWLDDVELVWRRLGLGAVPRHQLRRDLERDLVEALRSGASVVDVTSEAAHDFALSVAVAQGICDPHVGASRPHSADQRLEAWWWRGRAWWATPRQAGYGNLVTTGIGGAALGAVTSFYLVLPHWYVQALPEVVATFLVLVAAAALTLAFALAAITLRFGYDPRLLRLTGVGLTIFGALSVVPTSLLARALDYTDAVPAVSLEIGIVTGFCSGGILLARWLAGRTTPWRPLVPRP